MLNGGRWAAIITAGVSAGISLHDIEKRLELLQGPRELRTAFFPQQHKVNEADEADEVDEVVEAKKTDEADETMIVAIKLLEILTLEDIEILIQNDIQLRLKLYQVLNQMLNY